MPICLPATELYYNNVVNYTAMVSGRSTMCSLQQCRMEDHKKPNVLEEFDEFVGSAEEKFKLPLREMEDRKMSYLGIRVNPSSRQPRGRSVALCARHRRTQHQARPCQTRHEANGWQKFSSAESRIQSAVPRGQSVGQLSDQEVDLKRRIPMETSRSGLGSSVIKTQGSGQVDQVGYGDQC